MNRISFENPPVVELVLGVQFSKELKPNQIFEFYHSTLAKEYSTIAEVPALPAIFEKIDKFNDMTFPNPMGTTRKHFTSTDQENLLQIQHDRFLVNWRSIEGKNTYPHFENVFEKFKTYFAALNSMFGLLESVNQYELTYVDHFVSSEWAPFAYKFKDSIPFLAISDVVKACNVSIAIPKIEIGGNLNLTIQSAIKNVDSSHIVVSEANCRGFNDLTLDDWFAKARDIQLECLLKITTTSFQNTWVPKKITN